MTAFVTTDFVPALPAYSAPRSVALTRADKGRARRVLPAARRVGGGCVAALRLLAVGAAAVAEPALPVTPGVAAVGAGTVGKRHGVLPPPPAGRPPAPHRHAVAGGRSTGHALHQRSACGPTTCFAGPTAGDGHRPPEVRRPVRPLGLAVPVEQLAGPRGSQPGRPGAGLSCPGHLHVREWCPADVRHPAGIMAVDQQRQADRAERTGVRCVHHQRTCRGDLVAGRGQ